MMAKPEKIFALAEMDEGYRRFIEREDIIRCRDCDYVNDDPSCTHPRWRTGQSGVVVYPPVDPDGFCAWAVKCGG